MSIFPTDGERLESLKAEIARLKEACAMLREDRDTWKATYKMLEEKMNESFLLSSKAIARLKAEIARKDEALRWYAETVGHCNKTDGDGSISRDRLAKDHGRKAIEAIGKVEEASNADSD